MSDCGCYLCNGVTQHEQDFKYICDTCKEEGLKYTQQDLANKTGLKQPHIGGYLKDMEDCEVLRKPIKKILKAQGKWYDFERMWAKLIQKSENSS